MPILDAIGKTTNTKRFSKIIFAVLFVACLLSLTTIYSFAQTSPLQKADNDYAFQYGKYVEAHNNYLSAKSSYATFKTAASKNDAYLKTKDYLKQVHAVYVSYLLLAKEIGNTFDWGENSQNKNDLAKNLDLEINAFQENSKKLNSTQTLEELPPIATDLDKHIKSTTSPLISATLITYRITEVKTRIKQMTSLSQQLDGYAKGRLTKEKYDAFFANWNTEIKKIQESAQKTLDDTNSNLGSRTSFSDEDVLFVTKATTTIFDKFKQANRLFEEVLRL